MKLAGLKPGDIIEIDKKGRRFHARVISTGKPGGGGRVVTLIPLDARVTYRVAVAREVVGHWRKAAG